MTDTRPTAEQVIAALEKAAKALQKAGGPEDGRYVAICQGEEWRTAHEQARAALDLARQWREQQ